MELDRLKGLRLTGLGKITHKLFLLMTYPFRHIFKFLAFLFVTMVILASIPMMKGVRYQHILDWYLLRYDEVKTAVPVQIKKQLDAPTQEATPHIFKEVAAPRIIKKSADENSTVGRQPFKPAINSPRAIKAQEIPEIIPVIEVLPQEATAEIKDLSKRGYYRIDKSLPLVYEENPAEIKGSSIVFSANDLTVGNTYLYLYGIYTDTEKYDADKARLYLEELTAGKQLSCKIVAYTHQNIATGVCFLDGRSINQNLVDAGFADNVAL